MPYYRMQWVNNASPLQWGSSLAAGEAELAARRGDGNAEADAQGAGEMGASDGITPGSPF